MILVTGANGLVGSFVVPQLLASGYKVRILVRKSSDLSDLKEYLSYIETAYGDVSEIDAVQQALEGCEYVIHCAAIIAFGDVSEHYLMKVNVEGTANIVNACLHNGIKRLVYLSSIAAIGRNSNRELITEDTKWVNDPSNSVYAVSKYAAEQEVWRGVFEGLEAVIVCPSIIIGPGNWNRGSTKIFKNIYEGMLFYPTGSTNVVDVRDVADAVCAALETEHSNQRYIINGATISYFQFFSLIAKGFGKKAPRFKVTEQFMVPAYYVLRLFIPFYFKKRLINRETIRIASNTYVYSNQKYTSTFKKTFRNLTDTIAWTTTLLLQKRT